MDMRLRMFAAATCFIAATPGPNMLLVLTSSVRHGFRRSVATMAGCLTALVAMMAASAAGLGALLQAAPAAFGALKAAGAVYLAYLGARMWLEPQEPPAQGPPARLPLAKSSAIGAALYRQGLLVAASNPKAILFAAAFFPQFLDPARPRLPQFAVLLGTFAVIECCWYCAYAAGGKTAAAYLKRPPVRRAFDRVAGAVFMGFAAALFLG